MKAHAAVDLVRIARVQGLEDLICCIYRSSNECLVASELSESLDLNGLCLIPTKTVRYFDRVFDKVDFYKTALGAWQNPSPHLVAAKELSCDFVKDLRLLAARKTMLAIYMEMDDPDVCFVGTAHDVAETSLLLDRVSSRGERIDEPMEIELATITKIEFASRYLVAIGHVASVMSSDK